MTAQDVLSTLKRLGRPQTAAIYTRHGSGDNVYGVLTSEIAKLKKAIKVDHALALELWASGNAEARILALQVADPEALTVREVDAFVDDPQARFLACYLSDLLARSPAGRKRMAAWMKSPKESRREVGYGLLAARLKASPDAQSDEEATALLATIEKEIHRSPNFARHAMNNAVIAIGTFKPALRKAAVETARRIGKVEVDHGQTSCTTPDAAAYIAKASARKRCP